MTLGPVIPVKAQMNVSSRPSTDPPLPLGAETDSHDVQHNINNNDNSNKTEF